MYSSFVTTSYTYRLCLALCLHLACACFVAKVVRRAEAGWRRVCAVTPVLAVNCLLPAVFHDTDEVVTKSMLLICLFWLSNFKALALCLDRGPLLKQHSLNRFLVVYLIPIVLGNSKAGTLTTCNVTAIASMYRPSVNSTQHHWAVSSERSQTSQVRSASTYTAGSHGGQTSNFGRPFLAKAVVLACMTFTLINYGDSLSTWSTHILYGKYLSFDNPSRYQACFARCCISSGVQSDFVSHVAEANIVATCEVDLHASFVQQISQGFSSCMRTCNRYWYAGVALSSA